MIMSPIATANRPVSTIFGSTRMILIAREGAVAAAARTGTALDLGSDDFFPQFRELLLVRWPYLLLRYTAKCLNIGGVDRRPLGLEQFLRLGEIVNALGQLADRRLRGVRSFLQQFLLHGGQP